MIAYFIFNPYTSLICPVLSLPGGVSSSDTPYTDTVDYSHHMPSYTSPLQ